MHIAGKHGYEQDGLDELHLPARPSRLSAARAYAWRAAAAFGFDAEACDEFVFAVNEAVTNAIRHGLPDEHGLITLHALSDGESLTMSVRDHGTFLASPPPVTAYAESGRGFALMTRLTDAVQLSVGQGTTTVHLSKTLSRRASVRLGEH
jgi:anti-sigma regulatory factor (Ser/Thr protein kinase)